MSNRHELKSWPEYYQATSDGYKKFEIRKNDRNFKENDILVLNEWNPETGQYTGRSMWVRVRFIIQGQCGLPEDLCVMGIVGT